MNRSLRSFKVPAAFAFTFVFVALLSVNARGSVLVPANDPNLQYRGRFDFTDPRAPRFDWSAVSISARFQGARVGILLDDGKNDYAAYIDGKVRKVIVTGTNTQYDLTGLPKGTHNLVLVKRTEASFGIATFKGLVLEDGTTLLPLDPPPSRRIEVIGDSLACGAEDEDENTDCDQAHQRPTENGDLAYGPLAARALCADVRVIAYSAKGMVVNAWDPPGLPPAPLPVLYPRVLANSPTPALDPKSWVPDAVVVELGGNDFFAKTRPSRDEFEDGYRRFLSVLRADYPKAHVFCVSFSNSFPLEGYVKEVVDQENRAGDGQVGFMELTYPWQDRTGCYSHPTLKGQQRICDGLVEALKKGMGWGDCDPKATAGTRAVTPTPGKP